MTPSAAIRILSALRPSGRGAQDALDFAIAALQKEALMSEAIQKSGGRVLIVDHVQQEDGLWFVASIHDGPTVGAKTLVDALAGLLEKIGDKVKP